MKTILSLNLLLLCTLLNTFPRNPAIEDLNWISGYWTASIQGVEMEELWMPVAGNSMLGLHRDIYGTQSSFEYLRIFTDKEGNIIYQAAPSGRDPIAFPLTELKQDRVVFENLNHDFPQRIIYTRSGNELTARIENESGEKHMQWTWKKTLLHSP